MRVSNDVSQDTFGRPEMDDAANDEEQRNGNGQKQTGPIQSVVTSKEAPTEAIDDSDHRIQRIDQPPPFWKDGTHKSHWERYKPNCTMNGTMNRKSRYLTINEATQRPAPNDAANAKATNNGRKTTLGGGGNLYQIINNARKTAEMRKSTKLASTLLAE